MLLSQWAEDDRENDDDYNGNGRHVGNMLLSQWADGTEEIEQHAAKSVSQFIENLRQHAAKSVSQCNLEIEQHAAKSVSQFQENIRQHAAKSVSQFYQENVQGMTENCFQKSITEEMWDSTFGEEHILLIKNGHLK